MVAGFPRFNQGLADKLFSVDYNGTLPETNGLRTQRRLFQSIPPPWLQQRRKDPASLQRELDERLAEADNQSKELDASSTVWDLSRLDSNPLGCLSLRPAFLRSCACFS